jgi:4'-phosphopantetheinyl transferase
VLEVGAAHVWIVRLDDVGTGIGDALDLLSPSERARLHRLASDDARCRYARSRAMLRRVLASVLGREPAALEFTRGARGKPAVAGAAGVDFSFSDTRDCALIAVSALPTGVDAETTRTPRRWQTIAERIFHTDTVAQLLRLPAAARDDAFIAAWTQREAHVKAVGGGLFHTPDVLPFDALLPADNRLRAVCERGTGDAWTLARLRPTAETYASLVFRGYVDVLTIHDTLHDPSTRQA